MLKDQALSRYTTVACAHVSYLTYYLKALLAHNSLPFPDFALKFKQFLRSILLQKDR